MRVSLNWIKKLLNTDDLGMSDDALVQRLNTCVAEIDDVEQTGPQLDGVVVGQVLACEQHPDADRLRVCQVNIGDKDNPSQIVCGAPNVAAGQKVPVATVGCTLSMTDKDGNEQSIKIKKSKLRGVPSAGMICAEDELGIGTNHDGIMVLDDTLSIGSPLAEHLDGADTVLVIDNHNINHRPDLWGHYGWAREIACICKITAPAELNTTLTKNNQNWSCELNSAHARAYVGTEISGVNNASSPEWMQQLLSSAGVRPLGLLVDITNYVMLELGEPMHAFDRRSIAGSKILVREAVAEEAFTTLDDNELKLQVGDLLIADEEKSLALAGIMGGENSKVADDTSTILLEAALFYGGQIRRTRMSSGVSSESSSRFEKNLYPEFTAAATNRAIELLKEVCPHLEIEAQFAQGETISKEIRIPFDAELCNRYMGITIDAEEQLRILNNLGFKYENNEIIVPWWRRKDVKIAVDLLEEVGRHYGYDRLEPKVPRLPASTPPVNQLRQAEHRCRSIASAQGWDEVATYGFTSESWCELLKWPQDKAIRLQHPLSSEQTVMRQDLLPTLCEAASENSKHSSDIAIYEIGKIYGTAFGEEFKREKLAEQCQDERLVLAGICTSSNKNESPFYQARDLAQKLVADLGYKMQLARPDEAYAGLIHGRSAELRQGKNIFARIGEVDQAERKHAKLSQAAAYFIIELERLCAGKTPKPIQHHSVSRYQAVDREYTFVANESLMWQDLSNCVQKAAGNICQRVDLITIYRGEQIEENHKAVSLRVILQADDRTLSEKELQKTQNKIIKSVEHQTQAKLRG